jgi:hypothetical protein
LHDHRAFRREAQSVQAGIFPPSGTRRDFLQAAYNLRQGGGPPWCTTKTEHTEACIWNSRGTCAPAHSRLSALFGSKATQRARETRRVFLKRKLSFMMFFFRALIKTDICAVARCSTNRYHQKNTFRVETSTTPPRGGLVDYGILLNHTQSRT